MDRRKALQREIQQKGALMDADIRAMVDIVRATGEV